MLTAVLQEVDHPPLPLEVYRSKKGDLDHWLTERYYLYSRRPDGALYRAEVHHHSWRRSRSAVEGR